MDSWVEKTVSDEKSTLPMKHNLPDMGREMPKSS